MFPVSVYDPNPKFKRTRLEYSENLQSSTTNLNITQLKNPKFKGIRLQYWENSQVLDNQFQRRSTQELEP